MTLTFIVPMPASVTNASGQSRHYLTVHGVKRKYWGLLDALASVPPALAMIGTQLYAIPKPPSVPFARVSIRSVMHLGGAMDEDNAMARHKPLLDWLKTRGYLVDDRKKNIKWEDFPEQIVKRDKNYRIELTVTPISV